MGVRVRQKDSSWWVFINHKGKRKAKKIGDRNAALEVARKLEAGLALGDLSIPDESSERPPNFQEYAERWLESYAKVHCRVSTYMKYGTLLRHYAFPRFGGKPVSEVSREDIKNLIAGMLTRGIRGKPLSRSTVRHTVAVIREIYNHGIEDGMLVANPAIRLGRFLKAKADPRSEIAPFTEEEVARFLQSVQDCAPRYYPLFLCLVRTGLRIGEAFGLQWGDLDFQGRFIEVRRNYTRGRIELPKNGKIRRVDMSIHLAETLLELKTLREAEAALIGQEFSPEAWVFINEVGGPLDETNFRRRVFHRCLARAGLRRIRLHDLRHSYASILLGRGESLVYVKEQMGHHSIKVTVDTYGHLIPGANKAAVDRLDSILTATKRNLYATDKKKSFGMKP